MLCRLARLVGTGVSVRRFGSRDSTETGGRAEGGKGGMAFAKGGRQVVKHQGGGFQPAKLNPTVLRDL